MEGIVASALHEYLAKFLEENPKEAGRIMKKVILAAEAREAAAKAKKALKDRKSILNSGGLPGKLMDCTSRNRDESELFLVEGQSAGGSADNGRDRFYQAVLPLRGKVLNVEKARVERVLENTELVSLISAIGIDIGNTEEIERLRYGKIIILTDADVDGQHIRTLILTFFYRQMRQLIERGHIYVARPPLFKVEQKKSIRYVQTMDEMARELLDRGISGSKLTVVPPDKSPEQPQLFEGERLKALMLVLDEVEGALAILERRGLNVGTILSRIKDGKLPTFRVLLGKHEHWFFTTQEVDKFRTDRVKAGHELVVADDEVAPAANGHVGTNGHQEVFSILELHEVKTVNRGLEKLRGFGLLPSDLVPAPRLPAVIRSHASSLKTTAASLCLICECWLARSASTARRGSRSSVSRDSVKWTARSFGTRRSIPLRRTLLKVQLDDALKADEMFRILMGEKVEPRREFIQKHALEVKEIDYHGA